MPEIQAFRGVRYNLGHVGALSDVVAPPYDVIDPELQDQLYRRHAANSVRIILNRAEPGDDEDSRYERAGRFFKNWLSEGILEAEGSPAIYVYHQQFDYDGTSYVRRGFMCGTRLQPFGQGNIYPHEETHPKAKVDRLKLTKALKANCSQIFGLYPDPENAAQEILDAAVAGTAGLEAIDHLGVKHTLWPVSDIQTIGAVAAVMHDKPVFVADGHHRYETACNYRQFLVEQQGELPADHPANFVMMMCVSMNDPGMIVLPTHRLLRGTDKFSSTEIIQRLGDCFTCQAIDGGIAGANAAWQQMEAANAQGLMALYGVADQKWVLAEATPTAQQKMRAMAADHSEQWSGLGVSLLHRLVIDELLGAAGHPKPTYVHLVQEVIDGIQGVGTLSENDSNEPFTLAALVMPATVEHVEAISLNKERMPAKSTYFYPKLLSGLVFKPLA